MSLDDVRTHRWSGWPGAYCLYCGIADPLEAWVALEMKGQDDAPPADLECPVCPSYVEGVDPYTGRLWSSS